METIKIKCTTGLSLPLNEMSLYSGKLKKHSLLEIERLVDIIKNDGFLFPIAIGKVNGKNYIIDGECTYLALYELKDRGFEIPEIPVFYVKSNEDTIGKNILLGTSTNHCVTEISLKEFAQNNNLEPYLKELGFSNPDLIDFHTDVDLDLYVNIHTEIKDSKKEELKENFEGLFK